MGALRRVSSQLRRFESCSEPGGSKQSIFRRSQEDVGYVAQTICVILLAVNHSSNEMLRMNNKTVAEEHRVGVGFKLSTTASAKELCEHEPKLPSISASVQRKRPL